MFDSNDESTHGASAKADGAVEIQHSFTSPLMEKNRKKCVTLQNSGIGPNIR